MKNIKKQTIRYGCVIVAILMIGIGISIGQPKQIYEQAIRICLECIGIG